MRTQITAEMKKEDKLGYKSSIIRSTANLKWEWKWERITELLHERMRQMMYFGRIPCTQKLELVISKGHSALQKWQKENSVGLRAH